MWLWDVTPAYTGCGSSPVDLQGVHSIPALNPVLPWLTCLADETAIFVPGGGKYSL